MFQECFKAVENKIEEHIKSVFKEVSIVFEGSLKSVSGKLSFKKVSKEFQGSLKTVSMVFQERLGIF